MRHLIPLLAVCMLFGCERIRQQDRVLPPLDSLNALAITDLRDRLADRPSDTEAWYGLALSLAMEEDSADALYALTQAMSQELDSVYLPLRAHLHGWAGQTTEALSYAEAYWATHSPNWDLRVAMGKWTAELGAPRTGLLYVNEALNKLPGYGPYLLAKANLFLYHLGDSVQGERWLRLAANTEGGWGEATQQLINVLLASSRSDSVRVMLRELSNQFPAEAMVWQQLATLYEQLGVPDSALMARHRALDLQPGERNQLALANLHRGQRQWDSTRYYAELVLGQDTTSTEAWRVLARMADSRYRYNEALTLYGRILGLDSTDQIAKDELANVQRKVAYLRRQRAQDTLGTSSAQ